MLPKDLVTRLRRLEITTRRAVSETLSGQYHSVFRGRGMAFSEVRLYQPGDEIRTIDWNVSARMNEPYVKVFTEERELTVMLLVDVSRSQDFGTSDRTKEEVAAEITALIAFSAIANGDRVGAILFTDRVERFVPPKKGRRHVMALLTEILMTKPVGRGTDVPLALRTLANVQRRRTVAFVLSDFLGMQPGPVGLQPLESSLKVARRRHDVVPVAITDPVEAELPALGVTWVEDPETGRVLRVDLRDPGLRRRYARLVAQGAEARRKLFRRLDLDSVEVEAGGAYVKAVAAFFAARARRMAG